VAPDARPRIERHEAEGLGGRRVDDFLGAHSEASAHQRELIRERDVDVAEDVLVKLGQLGDLWTRDLADTRDDLAVQHRGQARAGGSNAAHDLGDVFDLEGRVRRVDALRREGQEEILAHLRAPAPEDWKQQPLGGLRVGRALEDHELAGMIAGGDFRSGGDDEGNIRILGLAKRSGHADDHDVAPLEHGEVRRCLVSFLTDQSGQILIFEVRGVGLAGLKGTDPVEVRVDADHAEPSAGEFNRQRQAHVSLSNDGDTSGAISNTRSET
jgi:hypothetical protein